MTIRLIIGDCREKLRKLPDASVHCCVTSPPYFGLRDYGTADWQGGDPTCEHKVGRLTRGPLSAKQATSAASCQDESIPNGGSCPHCGATRIDRQMGLEPTPDEFVAGMVEVFREVRRVLRDDGTLWLNIGDSYNNRAKVRTTSHQPALNGFADDNWAERAARGGVRMSSTANGIKEKDLWGIPWMLARALRDPYYTGRIKRLEDRIWLAAMIDGEGCMFIHKRKAGSSAHSKYIRADGSEAKYDRTADTFGVGLEICNTSKAIIDRVSAIAEGGTFVTQGPAQNTRRKQTIYRWRVAPNEAKRIIREVYPHLVAKQHQARLLFNCPSSGRAAAAAHQAMMDLHNGVETTVDYPAPPTMFEPGWYLRQEIIWSKPSPMPESVRDRCTKAHEQIFLLSKSPRYFFDAEAIAEGADSAGKPMKMADGWDTGEGGHGTIHRTGREKGAYLGAVQSETRNKRSVWTVTTQPYSEAHFATYPPALIEPCILAGCPSKCCAKCGAPWVRRSEVVGNREVEVYTGQATKDYAAANAQNPSDTKRRILESMSQVKESRFEPSCGCDAGTVAGTVLDPFGGAGTTGLVADRLGRNAILIELNPEYAEIAKRRLHSDAGMFAEVMAA